MGPYRCVLIDYEGAVRGLPSAGNHTPTACPAGTRFWRFCPMLCGLLPFLARVVSPVARLPHVLSDWLTPERALPALLLVVSVVAVPILVLSPTGITRLQHLQMEQARADREVAQITRQIEQLRAEVARAKSDPAALERSARDELGLVRQTELVFQFGR